MKILSIETSCDETAVAIVEAKGEIGNASFEVLGNALFSQIEIHKEYGGVFPALAKREHGKNLVPLLRAALTEADMLHANFEPLRDEEKNRLSEILSREGELAEAFIALVEEIEKPDIDAIAVTNGPGLEPTLWVGISFAKALATIWNIPIVPVNHMEGHIFSSIFIDNKVEDIPMPVLGLLISGGHTELISVKDWHTYELVGETLDDAVGEAFDKFARMMDLPYPGGPEVSKLAEHARAHDIVLEQNLPRPMIKSGDCNFSFSGLKTAALYALKKVELTEEKKAAFAREFEDAVNEVLISKTKQALEETGAKSLVVGGGVAANKSTRAQLTKTFGDAVKLYLPDRSLTGDNAIMIALAGYFRHLKGEEIAPEDLTANGTLRLSA